MTLNTFDDGQALLSKELDSLVNAINRDYVKNGLVSSKGVGNYDVDVTSGTVVIQGESISVASDTLTLTDPASDADLDAGEFRVDLLSVDDTGTINVSEGIAAVNPVSPDIPTDEVPITLVIVDGSGSSLSAGDIRDSRTIADFESLITPIYGDASDGTITRNSNGNENGLFFTDKYTVESGVTRTVTNGVLVVHATDTITIDGTLTAAGQATTGGTGGSGGTNADGSNGNVGTNGDLTEVSGSGGTGASATSGGANGGTGGEGAGGGGGSTGNNAGGDGAQGGTTKNFTDAQIRRLRQFLTDTYDNIYDLSILAGCSGGGGGGGSGDSVGGGTGGDGGDGGNGGGVIALVAPNITGTGTVSAAGTAGQDGQDGQAGEGAGGGGGGGGSGGAVIYVSPDIGTSLTTTAAGGGGGSGGTGLTDAGDGGAGGSGANGFELEIS